MPKTEQMLKTGNATCPMKDEIWPLMNVQLQVIKIKYRAMLVGLLWKYISLIDICFLENHECARPYSNLIPFFCGSSKICQKRGDDALRIAKDNVREKYAIVGIMEDFPQTMKAFETLVPRFFMGAEVLYNRASQALHENSKTASRKGISSYIRNLKFLLSPLSYIKK